MSYLESFSSTLPIILLVLLGVILRRLQFLKNETINEIKKLVVNISLPLVLLNAFGTMVFELRYLWIIASVFLGCVAIMFASRRVGRVFNIPSRFFPFLMAGFEAGMMGYAIFGSIYGLDNIPKFAIFDVGQVLFVFLVLIPTMETGEGQRTDLKKTALFFVKTPVIIGMFTGIALNLTGLYPVLMAFPPSNALLQTSITLGAITIPLMGIVIGYDLKFDPAAIRTPLKTALIRMAVWVGMGFLFDYFLVQGLLGLGGIYRAALWVLFVLPPGFVIPLFITEAEETDRNYISNTLSISTILTLVAIVVVRSLLPV